MQGKSCTRPAPAATAARRRILLSLLGARSVPLLAPRKILTDVSFSDHMISSEAPFPLPLLPSHVSPVYASISRTLTRSSFACARVCSVVVVVESFVYTKRQEGLHMKGNLSLPHALWGIFSPNSPSAAVVVAAPENFHSLPPFARCVLLVLLY